VTQYFTQLNSYHVVLEVDPALQTDPRLLDKLYLTSPITLQQVPISTFVRLDMTKTAYLAINHQSQFPLGDDQLQSSRRSGARRCRDGDSAARNRARFALDPAGSFQGTAQAFQTSLASQPYLIAAALLVVYLILGVLYESFIHPITILSTLSAGSAPS
jgi:hydrophobic/amphiphilic exporter-1 (mainly G- bacteria), HAE1 family